MDSYFAEGKRKREKVGRKSDAIALYQQRKSEVRAGVKMPANMRRKGDTLSQVIDRALDWYRSHKPKQFYDASIHLEAIREDLGSKVAEELTPADVDKWVSKHKTWSPATRNRYKATWSRALQLALVSGHVTRNVARLVATRAENNMRVRWLTDDEEKVLYKVMSEGLADMVTFALHTGARKSEQFGLIWDQVDFERKEVKFLKTKTGGDRTVPMSKTCHLLLLKLHTAQSETNNRIFQSVRYDLPIDNPRKAFEVAVRKANIAELKWHDLRHTFASRLVMKGADLYKVSKLMGHGNPATTSRYAHLAPEHLVNTVTMLDS